MHISTVIFDACVLYPAPLRDFLMHLAITDLFRARWTDAIHDEWTRSVAESRPVLKPAQLQRTRDLMNAHVRDCLVTGYEELIRHSICRMRMTGTSSPLPFTVVRM